MFEDHFEEDSRYVHVNYLDKPILIEAMKGDDFHIRSGWRLTKLKSSGGRLSLASSNQDVDNLYCGGSLSDILNLLRYNRPTRTITGA